MRHFLPRTYKTHKALEILKGLVHFPVVPQLGVMLCQFLLDVSTVKETPEKASQEF